MYCRDCLAVANPAPSRLFVPRTPPPRLNDRIPAATDDVRSPTAASGSSRSGTALGNGTLLAAAASPLAGSPLAAGVAVGVVADAVAPFSWADAATGAGAGAGAEQVVSSLSVATVRAVSHLLAMAWVQVVPGVSRKSSDDNGTYDLFPCLVAAIVIAPNINCIHHHRHRHYHHHHHHHHHHHQYHHHHYQQQQQTRQQKSPPSATIRHHQIMMCI
jgi:hypothetical protein